jgi:hypothetical protein
MVHMSRSNKFTVSEPLLLTNTCSLPAQGQLSFSANEHARKESDMNRVASKISAVLVSMLLLQFSVPGMAETTVYQWLDESGNAVFSDSPRPGAREISIAEPPTYAPPQLPADNVRPVPDTGGFTYQRLELVEPQPRDTVWNNRGDLQIRYEASPPLRTELGHRLVISLDGKARPPIAGSRYHFENLDRGAHQFSGKVINAAGEVLIESDPATIYLQQQSIHYPAR